VGTWVTSADGAYFKREKSSSVAASTVHLFRHRQRGPRKLARRYEPLLSLFRRETDGRMDYGAGTWAKRLCGTLSSEAVFRPQVHAFERRACEYAAASSSDPPYSSLGCLNAYPARF
jgi:hypothetical protein